MTKETTTLAPIDGPARALIEGPILEALIAEIEKHLTNETHLSGSAIDVLLRAAHLLLTSVV